MIKTLVLTIAFVFACGIAVPNVFAQDSEIPSWIKNNAGWWADGQIDDRQFVSGIQWLISSGIMIIPPTEQGTGSDNVIPSWIKNNAGWWADGQIDDGSFVSGLQFLIKEGVIKVHVEFWLAELSLQLDKSKVGEPITVTVVEPDMNLDFFNRDSLYADVYSTDTPWEVTAWHKPSNKEFELLITETSSGIFEGKFRSVPPSWWGDPWFTKSGDTIIVEYTDCTLPTPWSLADCLTISDKVKLD